MKQIEVCLWWLPPKRWEGPSAKPYLSSWKMSAEEAAAHKAIRPDLTSRELRQLSGTKDKQRQLLQETDTSR